jgi:transcriptional regulator with XRE-family HTH domain
MMPPRRAAIRRGKLVAKPATPVKTEAALVQQLTNLRLSRGVSQEQLARQIGITQPAIAKIEALRVKNLRFRTLSRAAIALGASLEMKIVPRRAKVARKKAAHSKVSRDEEGDQ